MMVDPFETGVLDREVHARLVADLDNITRVAHVPKTLVWTPLAEHCSETEVDYLRGLPAREDCGLCFHGRKPKTPVHMRMMAMAAACLRNFIDAKVLTVQEVLESLKKGVPVEATVLMIPNFYIGAEQGGKVASWQVASLLGLLMERQAAGQKTFVYVEDLADMAVQYGDLFAAHFKNYFTLLKA